MYQSDLVYCPQEHTLRDSTGQTSELSRLRKLGHLPTNSSLALVQGCSWEGSSPPPRILTCLPPTPKHAAGQTKLPGRVPGACSRKAAAYPGR